MSKAVNTQIRFSLLCRNFQIAAAKGVLRTLLCNGDFSGECIPVDFAINGIIGIAKSVATSKLK